MVAFHYLFNGIVNGKIDSISLSPLAGVAKYGYMGVELFFLISGFVILTSARGKTPRRFAVGRAVRLYPAFWVAVVASTVLLLTVSALPHDITIRTFLANLTMAPSLLGAPFIDGVYWTLIYELEFYALVFALLLLGQGRRLDLLLTWWVLAMSVLSFVAPAASTAVPLVGGYFLLFGCGAVVAAIRDGGWTMLRGVALAAGFAAAAKFEVGQLGILTEAKDAEFSPVVVVAILALFTAALLAMRLPGLADLRLPKAQAVGALTFPFYLLHATFGYTLLQAFATDANKWIVYPLVVAVILGLSWLLHKAAEVWSKDFWWKFFDHTVGVAADLATPRRATRRAGRLPLRVESR